MSRNINLMPAEYRRTMGEHRARGRWFSLFALGLLAIAGCWTVLHADVRSRRVELAELKNELEVIRTQADRVRAIAATAVAAQAAVDRYHNIALPVEMSEIVGCLAALLPDAVVLVDMRLQLVEQPVSRSMMEAGGGGGRSKTTSSRNANDPAAETRRVIQGECSGLAISDVQVAEFLGRLDGHPMFNRPQMDYSRNVDRQGTAVREFRITFQIDTNVIYNRSIYHVERVETPSAAPTDGAAGAGGAA